MLSIRTKRNLRVAWIIFLLIGCLLYAMYGNQINEENISLFLSQFRELALIMFCIICVLRGLTMVPSTPFLIAGILLFASTPVLLLFAFLTSTFVISAVLFYASDFLDLAAYFKKHHSKGIQKLTQRLSSRYGFYFIMFWAFAPFTPTDLICYVAGSLRLRFVRFILPLIVGEGIISSAYIFIFKNYSLHL